MDIKRKLQVMQEIKDANARHVEEWRQQMESKKIKGVLIDVVNGTAGPVEIDKSLESYYEVLGCRCIDIVRRKIGGRYFDIICDDEGMLYPNAVPSAFHRLSSVELVGNLFIVKFDGEEDVESLTDDEVAHVMKNVNTLFTLQKPEGYQVLWDIDY